MTSKQKTTTAAMPVSKAKTAYGLLSEIRALIVDEPKRYDQYSTLDIRPVGRPDEGTPRYFPPCGTIGCVAGWTVALKAPHPETVRAVCATAASVLGLDENQADQLFDAIAARGDSGTVAHAASGARHIARFQRKYRTQLLAKKV